MPKWFDQRYLLIQNSFVLYDELLRFRIAWNSKLEYSAVHCMAVAVDSHEHKATEKHSTTQKFIKLVTTQAPSNKKNTQQKDLLKKPTFLSKEKKNYHKPFFFHRSTPTHRDDGAPWPRSRCLPRHCPSAGARSPTWGFWARFGGGAVWFVFVFCFCMCFF